MPQMNMWVQERYYAKDRWYPLKQKARVVLDGSGIRIPAYVRESVLIDKGISADGIYHIFEYPGMTPPDQWRIYESDWKKLSSRATADK